MRAFRILSDPVRRRILERLCERALSAGEVVDSVGEEFGITQSAISQHLKVLREGGFIELETSGQHSHYRINQEMVRSIAQSNQQFFELLTGQKMIELPKG